MPERGRRIFGPREIAKGDANTENDDWLEQVAQRDAFNGRDPDQAADEEEAGRYESPDIQAALAQAERDDLDDLGEPPVPGRGGGLADLGNHRGK